jgi:hypothetical protein
MGVVSKELSGGLWIRNHRLPLLAFSLYILIGFSVASLNFYPSQTDLQEIDTLILNARYNDLNVYNDWGEGWLFQYRGYDTEYKKFFPQPDWNSLERPYYAFTKFPEELSGCFQLDKHSYYCQ